MTLPDEEQHGLPLTLTVHAAQMLRERRLDLAWVERVLFQPERIEADREDPTLRHAFGRIAERDGRVLRAVYNDTVISPRVVTIYFDPEADALYLRLDDSFIVESEEVRPGIVLDFNADDQVVGVEILHVKDRVPAANLRQIQFEVA